MKLPHNEKHLNSKVSVPPLPEVHTRPKTWDPRPLRQQACDQIIQTLWSISNPQDWRTPTYGGGKTLDELAWWNTHREDRHSLYLEYDGDATPSIPELFETKHGPVFPEFEPISHSYGVGGINPHHPGVLWQHAYWLWRFHEDEEGWQLIGPYGSHTLPRYTLIGVPWQEAYNKLRDSYCNAEGRIPDTKLERIIILRDALERQIRLYWPSYRRWCNAIKSVIKAWMIHTTHTAPIVLDERYKSEVKDVWLSICQGEPAEFIIEQVLPALFRAYSEAEDVNTAQIEGIRAYLRRRDRIIEEALPFVLRWYAAEKAIFHALKGEPLPDSQAPLDVTIADLLDLDLRMKVLKHLQSVGYTYKDMQDFLEDMFDGMPHGIPYADEESLRISYRRYWKQRQP